METSVQNRYDAFRLRLAECSVQELVDAFNREVGNKGWGTARACYLAALHGALDERGVDYSEIGDAKSLSFKQLIVLDPEGKKVSPLQTAVETVGEGC